MAAARKDRTIPDNTSPGHTAMNELDTHADTCCAGSNWSLLEFTGQICEVAPFLDTYDPVQEIPIARCCTVWTSEDDGTEYLLVGDEMLWFGTKLKHSLINPNQIRAYGIQVDDNPYKQEDGEFGIRTDQQFIPFETSGTIIQFGPTRVPTDWEKKHLPVVIITGDEWNPTEMEMSPAARTREQMELRTIRSLTSDMTTRDIVDMTVMATKVEMNGEVECELEKISGAMNPRSFCTRLISQVNIATSYREDVDARNAYMISRKRHSDITPEELARKWNVGLETAKETLSVTTQRGVRTAVHPMSRQVRVDHLNLHRPRLRGKWFVDTLMSKVKSVTGNTCANVFTQGKFLKVVPMPARSAAGESLIDFTDDIGIPEQLVTDGAGEFTGRDTEFVKQCRRMRIKTHTTEKGRKNQNHAAEREIGNLKKRWKLRVSKRNVPRRLWDFALIYESELLSRMARGSNRRTGYEEVTGETPEIGEWLDFEFYDTVWWLDTKNFPEDQRRLAKWIGISHRVGSDMCYWLITESGKLVSKTSVEHVTQEDWANESKRKQIQEFDIKIAARLNDENFMIPGDMQYHRQYLDITDDDDNEITTTAAAEANTPSDAEYGDMIVDDIVDADDDAVDKYLTAELILDVGTNGERRGRVIKRARGLNGEPIGRAHTNPLFDTREYEVEFTDGALERYTANVIAENMFAQVDDEGIRHELLDEIVNYRKDETAIPIEDGFTIGKNGNRHAKVTTRGWEILIKLKNGEMQWVPMKDVKHSNAVELAEFAVANRIADEPAFNWWVPHTLRKRNRILSKVKSKYWRTSHKFGIRLPHSVEEALEIDRITGTDFWAKAINKEMTKVKVAWKRHEGHTPDDVRAGKATDLIGFQEIGCHMVFDVKMDFTRKARFVAGGHTTETPSNITYSSVVSRDSVRLGFLIAALNGIDLMACDIENAYLNATCREKIWFEGGLECGEDKGKVLVVVRALYGLKGSGSSWRATLAKALEDCGFVPTKADPDVWIRPATRDDGFEYYEMLFVYVDDILCVSHQALAVLQEIGEFYTIKPDSLKKPDLYLGAEVAEFQLPDGRVAWSTSPRKYVLNAIKTVEALLVEDGDQYTLKNNARNPFPTDYKPELDVSDELSPTLVSRFLQLIGIARWAVEIGRIDIYHEISLLSQYQANPRIGHLEALYHVFAYMKKHPDMGRLVYDPKDPAIDERAFNSNADWTDFYGDVTEELPPKMPKPRGNPVKISAFVDANHAGNVVTRRSHSGIIIFVQNAPVIYYSKKQNTIEAASFGSEFVALRICKELIVALRYKLRMFGVPIDGPANVYCDNRGVVKNTSVPESVLTKKHNAINYHAVREAVAAGIIRVGKEDGTSNLADLFTKVVNGERRWNLCMSLMW